MEVVTFEKGAGNRPYRETPHCGAAFTRDQRHLKAVSDGDILRIVSVVPTNRRDIAEERQ